MFLLRRSLCLSFRFINWGRAPTIRPKKGQKRKHQKKLERWRTLLVLISCLVPWIVSHEKRKKIKRPKNPDLPHSFSSCLPLLDGRTPTPGGRSTYTLSTHKSSPKKQKKKKKRKKKLKKTKNISVCFCTFLFSFFPCILFPTFLSLFPTFLSLLSVQLISTGSHGRTSSRRATTGINQKN